ncbi:asparagine--tRNA ligase [Candidatus Dojkabacteria bacterium]|nr:asparagine--tRNA ligase [Candidatus Dojkabacteria bacterium]
METAETTISQISKHKGEEVIIKGWIHNLRSSGSIHFLQIRDGSGFIQAVVEKSAVDTKVFKKAEKVTIETSVILTGIAKEDKRAPSGFELAVNNLEIIQIADEYPIGKKEHGPEFLFDNRHLWLRSQKQWAIQRIRNEIINAIYLHLNDEGFIKIDSPIFTPNAAEGTSTLFDVSYLPAWKEGEKEGPHVYLAQTGQLYIEAAIFAHGKVFDFGPTFRAEKSKTRRHLTEFWMMDAEMAWHDWRDNMKVQEKLTIAIIRRVLLKCKNELVLLERDLPSLEKILEGDFPVLTHEEAVKKLHSLGSDIKERDDLGADDETILTEQFDKPIFIEKYPKEVKAFYMKRDPKDDSRVLNNDMLAPGGYGEVIGGSERETDYDKLIERMKQEKLDPKEYEWYLDLRKYGSVPHSGFGIGLERYIRWICGLKHIRETIPFPRTLNRITP